MTITDISIAGDAQLPVGVHPMDMRGPDITTPVTPDVATPPANLGVPPWSVPNDEAIAVYQRASHDWAGRSLTISGPVSLVGRTRGRLTIIVWVASSATESILLGPDEGTVTGGGGITLAPGDSLPLPTEAPVWAAPATAGTSVTVNYVVLVNPAGA